MSVLAGYSLNNSVAENFGRSALNLVLSGCSVDADGIDFSSSATNNATISYANGSAFRVPNNAPFSFHMRLRTGADVADETFIRASDPPATNNAGWYLMTNGSGVLEFNYSDNAGASRRTFTGPTLTPNTDYDISASINDMLGNNAGVTLWVNGTQYTPTGSSTSGAAVYQADAQVSFANWGRYGTARNSTHRLRKFALLDVASTAGMAAAWIADPDAAMTAFNSNLAIDSAPSPIVRGSAHNLVVSGAATAPTTGNTTIRLNGASGPTCTVNSVTGSGPWTINFTPPTGIAIKHSAVGYPLHVTINAESVQTAPITFNPAAGYSFVDLTSVNMVGNSLAADYSAFTPVVGDQIVYQTNSAPSSLSVAVSAASIASYSGTLTTNNSFDYYCIRAAGTVGAGDSFTFSFSSMTITSVNAGNPIPAGEGDIPIVLSGNGANVTGISINGVPQGFELISATLIYLNNIAWPNCMFGQTVTLTVTATGGVNASANVTMRPSGTNGYATADGTYNAATAGTLTGSPAVVAGDQVEFEQPSSTGVAFTVGGNWRPQFSAGNPGFIRARILDSSDHTFGSWQQYNFTAVSSGATPPVISSISNARMGQTITVLCTSAVNLSTATGLGITVGGVALTGVVATSANTLTGQMPVQGIQIGPNRPVQVSANGETSAAVNTTVVSALGQVVTLTVDYANLHPDSPMRAPGMAASYGGLVAGDQVEYASPSVPGGYTVTISGTGVVTLSGASTDPVAQSVQFALIDASNSYSRSPVGTWSIYASLTTRLALPTHGAVLGDGTSAAGLTKRVDVYELDLVNARAGSFLYSQNVTIAASGPTNLDHALNGPVGSAKLAVFVDSAVTQAGTIRTYAGYEVIVGAAS